MYLQAMLGFISVYSVVLWIYGQASGIWRYDLDWHCPASVGACALILIVAFVLFVVWCAHPCLHAVVVVVCRLNVGRWVGS
jgi:Na+-transporting NADH:ubiquinone oxidoreductase subunit NqrB